MTPHNAQSMQTETGGIGAFLAFVGSYTLLGFSYIQGIKDGLQIIALLLSIGASGLGVYLSWKKNKRKKKKDVTHLP